MRVRTLSLLCLLASPVGAQDSTITLWTREVLKSAILKEQRTIFVATPEGYRTTTDRYPVLVILDADDRPQFNLAIANMAFLADRAAIPSLIVVGIANGKDRTHDLTPVATGEHAKDFPTAGGAVAFADFIVDEVLPLVRSKYRTLPITILAGHSLGGLVALEVAAKKPGAFTGVIAMSPALWIDSSWVVSYSDAIAKAAKGERIFVTSGGFEEGIDRPTTRFSQRLDSLKPPLIALGHRRYPEDSHVMTPAPSLVDGLRFIFEPVSVPSLPISTSLGPSSDSAMIVNAVIASRRRYAIGARSLGLDERLPESQLNDIGYWQLLKKPALAVWVFRQNADLYPESAKVYDSLGDGLLAQGDTTAAMAQFRRAIDVATRTKHPILKESKKKLKALEDSRRKANAK